MPSPFAEVGDMVSGSLLSDTVDPDARDGIGGSWEPVTILPVVCIGIGIAERSTDGLS